MTIAIAPRTELQQTPYSSLATATQSSSALQTPDNTQPTGHSAGDGKLAMSYAAAASASPPGISLVVPADSTLGQQRSQLASALNTPEFLAWAALKGIDLKSLFICTHHNTLLARVKNVRTTFTLQDDSGFSAVGRPALEAAKALTRGAPIDVHYADVVSGSAGLETIAAFYKVPPGEAGIEALRRSGNFPSLAQTQTAVTRLATEPADGRAPATVNATQPLPALSPDNLQYEPAAAAEAELTNAHRVAVSKRDETQREAWLSVPRQSKLGLWLQVYRNHLETPAVQAWMREQHITQQPVINPRTGQLTALSDAGTKTYSLDDSSGWGQIAGPVLEVAKVIAPTSNELRLMFSKNELVVNSQLVDDFYGNALNRNAPDDSVRPAGQRSQQALDRHKLALLPRAPSAAQLEQANAPSRQTPMAKLLRHQQGDFENRRNLAAVLNAVAQPLAGGVSNGVTDELTRRRLVLHPYSSLADGNVMWLDLATFISRSGFEIPTTSEQVTLLSQRLAMQSVPPLGSFGGALSWPLPFTQDQLRTVKSAVTDTWGTASQDDVLGHLLKSNPLSASELADPITALTQLLSSPAAERLGKAIQGKLGGLPTPDNYADYVLAAINLSLDSEMLDSPGRNTVAGFDLAQEKHWGHSASTVIEGLQQHLISNKRATPATAALCAHLLLARVAPQFLVKDIPASVPYGSLLWTKLVVATAKIEAAYPGRVPGMTYAAVLQHSESVSADAQSQYAQSEALRDWGVASGLLPISNTAPNAGDIETLRLAFNAQLNAMTATSDLLQTPIPLRKEIALAQLREAVPVADESLYEKKIMKSNADIEHVRGGQPRSMLDIVMEGHTLQKDDFWVSRDPDFAASNFNYGVRHFPSLMGVAETFNTDYQRVITKHQQGHKDYTKHLIAKLPLNERRDLDEGKLEFFHTNGYRLNVGAADTMLFRASTLIVKTTRENEVNFYQIDTKDGTISKRNALASQLTEPYTPQNMVSVKGNNKYVIETFNPSEHQIPDQSAERAKSNSVPNSFSSARTEYISSVFSKSLRLDAADLRETAKGTTGYDESLASQAAIRNFFLNLIPLRSAIVNFQNGNYGEGIFDLALDAIGLITLGASKAAQAGRVVKGLTSVRGVAKATRFVASTGFEAINPLSGLGAVAVGGARLVGRVGGWAAAHGKEVVNKLRGASGSYNLLKTASETEGVVATGTYKVAGEVFEGGAVLSEGKWYAYNPVNGRAYGPPLPMFNAQALAMGGEMQNFRVLSAGLGMSEEMTSRGLRLTLDAHGTLDGGYTAAEMVVDGQRFSAYQLLDQIKASRVDLSKYTEIRLLMCHSANGGANSFAAQFAKLTRKPVKGYEGIVYTSQEMEQVTAAQFGVGGVRDRELIAKKMNGTHRTVFKYDTGPQTPDGRFTYTPSRDYNPFSFDAAGNPLPAKPRREPYTGEKGASPVLDTGSEQSALEQDTYDLM